MVCFNPGSATSVGASAANCSGPQRTGSRRSPDRPQARVAFARRGDDRTARRRSRRTPQCLQAIREPMRRRQSLMEPPPVPDRPRSGVRRTLGRPHQSRRRLHRARRDGRAQPPHPARRSLDRRSERRLHRRIRKLQTGRGPDARTKKGIRSPRRQSKEDVPASWHVGLRESRSCKGKLAFLRREVQSKVTSVDTASLRLSKRLLWLRYIQDHYLGGRRKLARMILVQGF